MRTIRIENDEHWRALRHQHVGGSEVAALFDEHAQVSRFELWQRKAGKIEEPDLSDNERVFWGSILEPAVAQGVAQKTGWTIRKVHRYYSLLPELGLGGSLDYEIVSHDDGPGILEIKTADWLVVRDWEEGEPPLAYELQAQSYMLCTGRKWGCIAVLIGGNDLRLFTYKSRPGTAEIIEREVGVFWQSIADNKSPPADYTRDGGTISRLYSSVTAGRVINLVGSNRAPELIEAYQTAQTDEKDAKTRKDAAKAELLTIIGDAERAVYGSTTISAKTVGAKHLSYERPAYRDFRINTKKDATK